MPIKYHQAALSFQVSHNLGYAVLRQDAYQHMNVLFLYSNLETFLSSFPLAIGYFFPPAEPGVVFDGQYKKKALGKERGPSSSQYLFAVKICRTACAVKTRL